MLRLFPSLLPFALSFRVFHQRHLSHQFELPFLLLRALQKPNMSNPMDINVQQASATTTIASIPQWPSRWPVYPIKFVSGGEPTLFLTQAESWVEMHLEHLASRLQKSWPTCWSRLAPATKKPQSSPSRSYRRIPNLVPTDAGRIYLTLREGGAFTWHRSKRQAVFS